MTLAVMVYAATMQTVAVLLLVVQSRFMWRNDIRAGAQYELVEAEQEEEQPEQLVAGGIPDAAQLHEVMKSPRLTADDFDSVTRTYNSGMYL